MPKLTNHPPKYRRHKASGQATVTLGGRDKYLGPYGTKASMVAYDLAVAEWLTHGRILSNGPEAELTVIELLAAYIKWAKGYYLASNELEHIKLAIRPLKALYGRTLAAEFGPRAIQTVRERMIADGLTRTGINARIGKIKRIFRWAVESEIVPPSVYHGLQAVRGLARGRTKAPEPEPIKPVPNAFVDALEGHVLPPVWAMIQLQRFTAMRPGEVTIMQTCDLDTSGKVWIYTPSKHKGSHRGHQRRIFFGLRAQSVLHPWMKTDLQAYIFSPSEAMQARRDERFRRRKTPLSYGNRAGTHRQRKPQRQPGDFYTVGAYRRAIKAGCKAADVPCWAPHQLRHNAATWLRKEFGLDTARVILGHRSPTVTEIYAELDHEKAMTVIGRVG